MRALARKSADCAQVSWTWRSHFYLLLRERRGEVLEKDLGFCQKCERIGCGVGAAASSIKAPSVVVLEQRVKHKPAFSGRARSLIF